MIYDLHIFICTNQRSGTTRLSCGEEHGLALVTEFKKHTKSIPEIKIRVNRAGCLGICDSGPTLVIYPEGAFYVGVALEDVSEIVSSHLIKGIPVDRLLIKK
jgi:(2Fe-2S) ferredoxin